jgi:SAM-dependent methyltransferase
VTYDEFAQAYAEHAASSVYNVAYERPALQALLPEVRGKRVLDAACASGEHSAFLLEHGASVVAVDGSPRLVEITRNRFPNGAIETHVADLTRPLAFLGDESVDVVLSSLTLHYLERWDGVLGEFHRALRSGGLLLFSTHHPSVTAPLVDDYFATQLIREQWTFAGVPADVAYYHRSLQAILDAVRDAGFSVDRVVEPRLALTAAPRSDAERRLAIQPLFLIIRANKSSPL